MDNPWLFSLLAVVGISLISLIGVLVLIFSDKVLRRVIFVLVAFSVGALLGDAFFHLLPEVFVESAKPEVPALFVLLGIIIFFCLEKFLRWQHEHSIDGRPQSHIQPFGVLNLLADGLHNFLDGMIIAASFLAGPIVGLATTVAVAFHEIPQEMGDFAILIKAGFSRWRALLFNLLSALVAVLGAIVALLVGSLSEDFIIIMLSLAAGGFIYIAGSDLVPELHKETGLKKSLIQLLAIIGGMAIIFMLILIE